MSGRVEALWTKRAHRGVLDAHHEVVCVAGRGIEGNTCRSSTRQVTIIAQEQWDAMMRELGGAFGEVLDDGVLTVGDAAAWESE